MANWRQRWALGLGVAAMVWKNLRPARRLPPVPAPSGDPGIYAMASLVFELLDETEEERTGAQAGALTSPLRGGRLRAARPGGVCEGALDGCDDARHGPIAEVEPSGADPSPAAPQPTLPARERVDRAPLPAAARRVEIVVAPGVSALQAAAARAGAPLGHDFCAISLSDLLTPWPAIAARIEAAARADFAIAFYNPVSQRRRGQLAAARTILLAHRRADTPIIVARNLGRDGERVTLTTLGALDSETPDMLSIVLVGASTTARLAAGGRDWVYTPRGYATKEGAR